MDKKLGRKIIRIYSRASKGLEGGQKRANRGTRKASKLNIKREYF